jgi:thiol-disulfide isomerase/thioredoxin
MVNLCFHSCPHCMRIKPVFENFVASHGDRHDIEFGIIDCDQNEDFCKKHPRDNCPSVLVFKDHKKPQKYTECPYELDWTQLNLDSCLALQVDL